MSYILAHVGQRMEREKGAVVTANARQELEDYLKAPLRYSGTDAVKWWGVSRAFLIHIIGTFTNDLDRNMPPSTLS